MDRLTAQGEKGDDLSREMTLPIALGAAAFVAGDIDGRFALRLAIGHIRTEQRHVERAWTLLQEAASRGAA